MGTRRSALQLDHFEQPVVSEYFSIMLVDRRLLDGWFFSRARMGIRHIVNASPDGTRVSQDGMRPAGPVDEQGIRADLPWSDALLAEIARQAEAGYPEEICGVMVGRRECPATYALRQVPNRASQEPQSDPAGILRDARTAYLMDPKVELGILRELDERGWELLAVYHSHPDHDAYFSAMDRDRALTADGTPLWPGVTYLVVSVRAGQARAACAYAWGPQQRIFAEAKVSLPER
jgi:[CysO sulfur-carrier protein]-S-L-cysteine hydrolase